MKAFLGLPLKWKLVLLFLLVSTIGIIFTGTLLIFNDLQLIKSNLTNNIKVLAKAIGENSRASLIFNDNKAAHRLLSSLRNDSQIKYGALFDVDGNLFSSIGESTYSANHLKDLTAKTKNKINANQVLFSSPLIFQDKYVGEIFVHAELTEYEKLILNYYKVAFGVLIFTVFISFSLALKLQGIISEPILKLSKVSKEISNKSDYSIRAVITDNHDEIMDLYLSFNDMLSQIEKRDKELMIYREHLESRVAERTQEIVLSNTLLQKEIEERQTIQKDLRKTLEDKEILLKEINHRAKNNMQIISSMMWLQAADIANKECAKKFIECGSRIRSMALVHEKIFNSDYVSKLNFADYLDDLSRGLLNTFDGDKRRIQITNLAENIYMDIDQTISCGLIVNELITNSLKHAFPDKKDGVIELRLHMISEDECELSVMDNGVGIPDGIRFDQPKTLGLELVKSISKGKLNGNFKLMRNEMTGFQITFKLS